MCARYSLTPTLLASCVAVCGCAVGERVGETGSPPATVDRLVVAMGTSLQLEVVAADRATALRASEAAVRAVESAEQRLSSWRPDSELSRFVATPVGAPFAASAALCDELRRAVTWARATDGAFDPTIGALVEAYDLRGAGRWPTAAELAAARRRCGIDGLQIAAGELRRATDLQLDAGAFGKGAGLDAATDAALAAGATAVTFDFGGQLHVAGAAAPRSIELADPRDRARPALRIEGLRGSVATTGNEQRRRVVDAGALGHLLDPRCGRPAADFGSVTIVAERALDADCLSTACFVLGPDAAIAFAERTDGVEAVVLLATERPRRLTARVSSGLRASVAPLLPELTIQ
jgi:thiamine biosynthesis lipoprotein